MRFEVALTRPTEVLQDEFLDFQVVVGLLFWSFQQLYALRKKKAHQKLIKSSNFSPQVNNDSWCNKSFLVLRDDKTFHPGNIPRFLSRSAQLAVWSSRTSSFACRKSRKMSRALVDRKTLAVLNRLGRFVESLDWTLCTFQFHKLRRFFAFGIVDYHRISQRFSLDPRKHHWLDCTFVLLFEILCLVAGKPICSSTPAKNSKLL